MMAAKKRGGANKEDGFTLVELMVVCLIMGLVVTAIGSMITHALQASSNSFGQVKVEEAVNEALDTIIRQLRGATAISPDCTTSLLVFADDVNGDGTVDEVRFGTAGGVLQKGYVALANGPAVLTNWIQGCSQFNLTYWKINDTNKQLSQIAPGSADWTNGGYLKIARIDVQFQISSQTTGAHAVQRTATGSVDLRNTLQDLF